MANLLPAVFFGHGSPMNAATHSQAERTVEKTNAAPKTK
jgi:aromatic ring-opening dioxygenase catalytic subunit (LigB family)